MSIPGRDRANSQFAQAIRPIRINGFYWRRPDQSRFGPTPKPHIQRLAPIFSCWANGGKTPAFHVVATFKAQVLTALRTPPIPPEPCSDCGDGDIMLPGIPITRTPHIDASVLTQQMATDIIAKRALIWLTGGIDYMDADGNPHKTFACYNFEWDGTFRSCDARGSNYAD